MSAFDWPLKELSVSSLRLDARNPRIPQTTSTVYSQNELINALFEHDDALDIVESIADKGGYFPHEVLIGVMEADLFVILEGNRRIAALKAIRNSSILASDSLRRAVERQITKMKAKGVSIPTKVRVAIAHNRRNAVPALLDRHTGTNLEKWKRTQQAAFIRNLIEIDGMTKSDISNEHGYTEGDIEEFLRADELYKLAKAVPLSDEAQKSVNNPRKFPLTNLERPFGFQDVREFFGVSFTTDGVLVGHCDKEEFISIFGKLVEAASKRSASRTFNSPESSMKHIKQNWSDLKPSSRNNKVFTSSDIIGKSNVEEESDFQKKKVTKTRVHHPAKSVIPRGWRAKCDSRRIQNVFRELKGTKLVGGENASAMLLRVLIDLSASNYIEKSGKDKELLARFDPKGAKRSNDPGWHPTLRQTITYIIDNLDTLNIDISSLELKALRKFNYKDNLVISLDSLDKFAHNHHINPTESELRAIWDEIEAVMKYFLVDPS